MGIFSRLRGKPRDNAPSTSLAPAKSSEDSSLSSVERERVELLSSISSADTLRVPWLRDILFEYKLDLKLDSESELLVDQICYAETLIQWCLDEKKQLPSHIAIRADQMEKQEINLKLVTATNISLQENIDPASFTHVFSRVRGKFTYEEAQKHIKEAYDALKPGGTALFIIGRGPSLIDAVMIAFYKSTRNTAKADAKYAGKGFSKEDISSLLETSPFPTDKMRSDPKKVFVTGDLLENVKMQWKQGIRKNHGGSENALSRATEKALDKAFADAIGNQEGVGSEFELVIAVKELAEEG